MSLPEIETVVRDRLGLDPEALGATALPRAVDQRMNVIDLATTDDYFALLTSDPAEEGALANALVVSETWFFRGGYPLFDALAGFLSARMEQRPSGPPVRVLSVPCSTGEEPFSLAIALDERQATPSEYRIEGVDLSRAHLARASAGRFTSFSFREPGPNIRTTHFQQTGDSWELRPAIRERVRFTAGNVTDPDFLAVGQPFDLILCRNLFIYLTEDARRRALANLDRLLSGDGWLVLSPSEADRLPSDRFVTSGSPSLGIYWRTGAVAPEVDPGWPAPRKPASRPANVARQREVKNVEVAAPARPEPIVAPESLETVRRMADTGQLGEARAACARLLARAPGDPDIYSLLGVVDLAEGRPTEAAESFRKALYLAPNHPDALSHMIVICDSRGDIAQAAALRKRLARARREEPT